MSHRVLSDAILGTNYAPQQTGIGSYTTGVSWVSRTIRTGNVMMAVRDSDLRNR
jgi:hypothetical protein